ncbi:hypothetical protein [Jidongwangia harbinensis]|uniref:hypothetical protein n=1 Tax=Jidongwangia harbinensis TaxID=2878561 RepID=UPI001CD957C2|nr:hypothetical protein [Jidongwangia harbinensis]MCA2211334.1 hypothetical protein [Jidongwangia harbinensis]
MDSQNQLIPARRTPPGPGGAALEVNETLAETRRLLAYARHELGEVHTLAQAVLTVRRTDAMEKVLSDALRVCQLLEREQFELKQDAAEAHLRTQRRAGELLTARAKHRGGRPRTASTGEGVVVPRPPTLRELGIEVHESHRWQRVAGIPAATFEEFVRRCREERREITASAALALARRLLEAEDRAEARTQPPAGAETARGEYYRSRLYIGNLIRLDPRALVTDLRGEERRQALAELDQLQQWLAGFSAALKRAGVS